jgi:hypothetical protein
MVSYKSDSETRERERKKKKRKVLNKVRSRGKEQIEQP